jgi:endonuclease VIII-like 1
MIKDFDKFESFIINNIDNKSFSKPIYELLLDQNYFNGVGNYLRSTIIYYANINPFYSSREIIKKNPEFLKLCKEILETSYSKNGGQLKDWINPFQKESNDFDNWVFYQKGSKIVDKNGRTFWYDPKWDA